MMAGHERARLIAEDDDLNLKDWPIEDKPKRPRPDRGETEEAANRAGFQKRDAVKSAPPGADKPAASIVPNRRRTGRTDQLNIRMTPEIKAKFKSLANAMDWSEAVAFEKALDLLDQRYSNL